MPTPLARTWSAADAATFTKELRERLHALGVFRGDTPGYVRRALFVLIVTAGAWLGFIAVTTELERILIAALAGYAGVQAAAIAHEAGHGAVSRSRSRTLFVGHLFMSALVGASYSAWVARHGAHHIHPNSRKDPDVRPWLFSFNEADAQAAVGLAGFCTRHQHWLLYPLSVLMGFSIKLAGWKHVLRAPAQSWLDIVMLTAHAGVWIALPSIWIGTGAAICNYTLLTLIEGAYLAFVFLANHLGGATAEEARHWPPAVRQIVTARNLPSSRWLTHLCIGLNTHIEHHVFGHLPATRLNEARAVTRSMCIANGIPYRECTVIQAFAEVHAYNRAIAEIARRAQRARQAVHRSSTL